MSNLLGIDTPARLLRQAWGSPTELAEELYAMFTAKGPAEVHDTLTIRVPEGKPALRIERSQAGDVNTTEFHHGGITKGRPAPTPTPRARRPATGVESRARTRGGTSRACSTAKGRRRSGRVGPATRHRRAARSRTCRSWRSTAG